MANDDKSKNGAAGQRARAPRTPPAPSHSAPQAVERRLGRYMVAALPQQQLTAMGIAASALEPAALEKLLADDPHVRVHRRLPAPERSQPAGAASMAFPGIVIAEMTYEHARALRLQLPQLLLERDRLLAYTGGATQPVEGLVDPTVAVPVGRSHTFPFLVRDTEGNPVPDAGVFVTGSSSLTQAMTGPDGRATVSTVSETPETIRAVLIKPSDAHWSLRVERPALSTTHDNLIVLKNLSESFPGFPDQQVFGWGQRAMHLHRLPPTFRGSGVKIAIIDSGVAVDHPDLRDEITAGLDLVDRQAHGWTIDTVGHGSHCAGIITGADNGRGVIGFAVESQVHACKIFPDGRFSDLIEALDYCIDNEIDIVNLSLGNSRPSRLVAAKIDQARNAGTACIVAAGDNGGRVNFPGSLSTVLTVAAIGRTDTFPPDTSHSEVAGPHTADGYFSATFSCHGPEVDVCAPGVAILSSAPPDTYALWDGTSVAAAHVTGLAALVLAHHGDFRNGFSERDTARVDHLFQLIKSSCTLLNLGDPHRSGAGLPDALRALGPALAGIPALPSDVIALLDRLTAEMIQAGLIAHTPTPTPEAAARAQEMPRPAPAAATEQSTMLGQTALAWLAEEMRTAGLLLEDPLDLLE